MQVFLPYPSFAHSVACLDLTRLGKQRLECDQILTILRFAGRSNRSPWATHPAVVMWRATPAALGVYMTLCVREWRLRGYKNTMLAPYQSDWTPDPLYHWHEAMLPIAQVAAPVWLGSAALHASHRANLLRKAPDYYDKMGWCESPSQEYVWPEPA